MTDLSVTISAELGRFLADMRNADQAVTGHMRSMGAAGERLSLRLRGVEKSARASARVFTEFDDAQNAFRALQGRLDPAVSALHQYEAAQEAVARAVRAGAVTQTQANQVLAQVETQYATNTRVLRGGAGTYRNLGTVAQQAGFQIADFAVQVQNGTNPMIALTQQGSQLLGMFGPWGAVVGAAGAIVGSLATALWLSGDGAESTEEKLERLALTVSGMEGQVRDLEDAAKAYTDAISASAGAQSAASDSIIADTKREFEAKRQLLGLEIKRQEAAQSDRQVLITSLQGRFDELTPRAENQPRFNAGGQQVRGFRPEAVAEAANLREQVQDDLTKATAEFTIAEISLGKAQEAFESEFQALSDRAVARTNGGRGPQTPFADALAAAEAQLDALAEEREQIGQTGIALERLQARQRAAGLERDLLTKAMEEGAEVTDRERVAIDAVVDEYLRMADANAIAKAAVEEVTRAQEEAAEAAEASSQAIETAFDGISSAITQSVANADSLSDALKRVGLQLANIAVQGAFGQGPLGSVFNDAIGVGANGLFGLLASAKGNAFGPSGQIQPFAKGGVVNGPTMFPFAKGIGLMGEAGPEAILPLRRGPGGRLGVEAGGGGGGIVVNVINNTGANVSAEMTEGPSGPSLEVVIDQVVARGVSNPASMTSRAMRQSFGVRPVIGRR